ncbi:DMT family transporter [Rossellomorea vietnamensis]|uniref:DMT family transporter n=1 Tax=Rossellomorea vietnamensis TaxID=218284 RepID=UPI00338EFF4D
MLAAVCWGISGGIAGILMGKGWDPIVISLYRGAVGFLCFFIWFLFQVKQNWFSNRRFYLWSILAGAGVAGNFTFYFLSIQAASIPIASTLMYTAPVFVLLLSFPRWEKSVRLGLKGDPLQGCLQESSSLQARTISKPFQ